MLKDDDAATPRDDAGVPRRDSCSGSADAYITARGGRQPPARACCHEITSVTIDGWPQTAVEVCTRDGLYAKAVEFVSIIFTHNKSAQRDINTNVGSTS